jgi:Protein of unknown function (DUF4058)
MPSPFPGMDPYLEARWHDFHERFLPYAAAHLARQVLPRYIVLIDENVYDPELDEERESFLGVFDREGRQLVTVVELLSPTNKRPGDNRERYLAKRAEVTNSPAHLVEIDLLRCPQPMPAADRPACVYSVLVSRAGQRPRAGFWPIGLRDPLPTVPVPLRDGDPDARLDLHAVLDRVYDDAGYEHFLYDAEPEPRLTAADMVWAHQLIPQKPNRTEPNA